MKRSLIRLKRKKRRQRKKFLLKKKWYEHGLPKLHEKLLLNSTYGMFGQSSFNFKCDEDGGLKSVSDFYKETQKCFEMIRKKNKVVYQDTVMFEEN